MIINKLLVLLASNTLLLSSAHAAVTNLVLVSSDLDSAVYTATIDNIDYTINATADFTNATLDGTTENGGLLWNLYSSGSTQQLRYQDSLTSGSWSGEFTVNFSFDAGIYLAGDTAYVQGTALGFGNNAGQNRVNEAATLTLSGFDKPDWTASMINGVSNDTTPGNATDPTLSHLGSVATMLSGSDSDNGDLISYPGLNMAGTADAWVNSFSFTYSPANQIEFDDSYVMLVKLDGSISDIPEPTSAALGLGITAMLCLTLRRRCHKAGCSR